MRSARSSACYALERLGAAGMRRWRTGALSGMVRTLRMRILSLRSSRSRRHLTTSGLLALLLFRAYVPVGFMPASGNPFLLELCPAADQMPTSSAQMPAHHLHHHAGSHTGSHTHFENCPFGSVPAAGPISLLAAFEAPAPAVSEPPAAFEAPQQRARQQRAHLPRGPPSPA